MLSSRIRDLSCTLDALPELTKYAHVTLVETWAEDVATSALTNELAEAVRVTVQKIDIFDAADGVGVSIERRRSATETR